MKACQCRNFILRYNELVERGINLNEPYRLKDSNRRWITPLVFVAGVILFSVAMVAPVKAIIEIVRIFHEVRGPRP